MAGERGYRVVPHTADVILEAWGPDLAACCEEAVAALVATYVEAADGAEVDRRRVRIEGASDEALLVDLLEEVVFTLDTAPDVPVGAEVRTADDGLEVSIVLADRAGVEPSGAVPKAISRSELAVERLPGRVSCRFLVDV